MIKQLSRRLLRVLSLMLLLVTGTMAQSATLTDAVDRYVRARSEMGHFNGAILVAKDGQIVLRKGYGYAEVKRRIPIGPESQFEVASISKMFTAFAALKLSREGKLRVDDSICKYIDECPESWRSITVSDLIHHTSGIPDYETKLGIRSNKYLELMSRSDASAKILEDAKVQPLEFKPGERFNYSNTGYIVLGYVIEKASKQPFERYIERHILRPARMKHSGVLGTSRKPKNIATGYTHEPLEWERFLEGVPFAKRKLITVPSLPYNPPFGDAGVYSTVDDLYHWSQLMDGFTKIASTEDITEIFKPTKFNYGYGWFTNDFVSRRRARHLGQLLGYTSLIARFPNEKVTIVLLSNNDRTPMNEISRDISQIVLGLPFDMPVRGMTAVLTDTQFKNLEGEYKMKDGNVLIIRRGGKYLQAEIKDRYTADLIPLSATEFYFPLADGRAVFSADLDGRITRVNLRYSGEDHPAQRIAN